MDKEDFLGHYAVGITIEEAVTDSQISLRKVYSMPEKPCQEAK